ncbi:hypothetical protein M885DRAFT_508080, partial [Pelagophyceae sp. CCMP2097]
MAVCAPLRRRTPGCASALKRLLFARLLCAALVSSVCGGDGLVFEDRRLTLEIEDRRALTLKIEANRRGKLQHCLNATDAPETPTQTPSQCLPGFMVDKKARLESASSAPPLSCEAHRFRLPAGAGPRVLCVPQKNGNRDFGLLVHLLHYGTLPES